MRRCFRVVIVVCVVLVVLLIVKSCSTDSLAGEWVGTGYFCDGQEHEQDIVISQDGSIVRATKITGDACIPAGQLTWEGEYTGKSFAASMYIAIPGQAASTIPVTVTVEDSRTLRLSGIAPEIVFTRL
jgi:hypothetical protein